MFRMPLPEFSNPYSPEEKMPFEPMASVQQYAPYLGRQTADLNKGITYCVGQFDELFDRMIQEQVSKSINNINLGEHAHYSNEALISMRFVVRTDRQIYFAKTGDWTEFNDVLAHAGLGLYQNALAAGDLYFHKATRQLILINNKSSDYKPDFQSLQIALKLLLEHRPDNIGEAFYLQKNNSVSVVETYHCTKAALQRYLSGSVIASSNSSFIASVPPPTPMRRRPGCRTEQPSARFRPY